MPIAEQGYELTVARGTSFSRVVAELHQNKLLQYPALFKVYSRLQKLDSQIKTGEYHLSSGLTPAGLLTMLTQGNVRLYRVTIPEGATWQQALDTLNKQNKLQNIDTAQAELELVSGHTNPEGWFFPETYTYPAGGSSVDILTQAVQQMQTVLEEEWSQRDLNLPYKSPYEALIMASIIEKETGVSIERPLIAGVFVRRLEKGMRLQTDPTVIYGLGKSFDGNLKRKHLRDKSNPYNTYRHHGLPPTPIALPGRAAIWAALHPAEGKALYFVAKGDGSHYFSETLAEHERAVVKYQLNR